MLTIVNATSCKYADENGSIECLIELDDGTILPFMATSDDSEPHGRDIHARIVAGEFGAIAPYQAPSLSDHKKERKALINHWRLEAEGEGFEFEFPDGITATVQTRERDMVNIVGLLMAAQTNPSATFQFRDEADQTHEMDAADMVQLGSAAQVFISATYQKAWALKALADAATTLAEVEAITWES